MIFITKLHWALQCLICNRKNTYGFSGVRSLVVKIYKFAKVEIWSSFSSSFNPISISEPCDSQTDEKLQKLLSTISKRLLAIDGISKMCFCARKKKPSRALKAAEEGDPLEILKFEPLYKIVSHMNRLRKSRRNLSQNYVTFWRVAKNELRKLLGWKVSPKKMSWMKTAAPSKNLGPHNHIRKSRKKIPQRLQKRSKNETQVRWAGRHTVLRVARRSENLQRIETPE